MPGISFSFFDVAAGKYKTVNTPPLTIEVTKGTGRKTTKPAEQAGKSGKQEFFDTLFTNRWLIVIPIAILILTGLLIWLQKDKRKNTAAGSVKKTTTEPPPPPVEEISEIPVNPFILSEEKMIRQDTRGFYQSLNNELRVLLANKFQLPLATINKKRIAEEADKKGVSVYTSLQIQQLLDDVEWQLYTPFAEEDKMQAMYDTANAIAYALHCYSVNL